MPPKKGKKGRRGDDSDDDPLGDQLAFLKAQNEKAAKEEGEEVEQAVTAGPSKKDKKKEKKAGKKGTKKDDSDDEDPLQKMKALALDDDDSEAEHEEIAPVKPVLPNKKEKKSKKNDTAVEEEEITPPAPVKGGKKGKKKGKYAESSDDEDLPPAPMVEEEKTSKSKKKDKKEAKKGKGKKTQDSDDDDADPLQKMQAMADAEDEEDEDEDEAVPMPVKKGKDAKKNKLGKHKEGKDKDDDEKEEEVQKVDDDSEEEEEEEEEEETPEKIKAPVEATAVTSSVSEPVAAIPAVAKEPVAPVPVEVADKGKEKEKEKGKKKEKPRKLSKLEQKLEQARKEKEERDAAAAVEAARVAAEEAEAEQRRKADAAAAAAKAKEQAEEEEDDEDEDDEEEGEDGGREKTAEEREKEARMLATMYGDDVFSEDARPGQEEGEGGGGDAKDATGAASDKKLSNKAKRRALKEAEAKERQAEYNELAMKASAEGAQFAVSQSAVDPNDPMWQNALDIVIPDLSISAHKKELFLNAELSIVHGRRYGLVGPNGAGKSTLLKMIAAGQLHIPPRIDYLYVEQEVVADDSPAVDAVLRADKERWDLVQEEKQIMAALDKLGPGKGDDKLDTRLGEVHAQLAAIGAASAESRARRILFGLGFDGEMQTRATKFFSGGWRMRISLARALFIEPTLLMLDEPTNHLDLNAVIWLDDYLQKWKKTLLIVSHDQEFLNSVCQEIIHLDSKKLVSYRGNYDSFKEQETIRRKQLQKDWEKQEKKLRELKNKGITKQNAEKAQLKAKSREPGARSKKQEAAAAASGGLESGESQVKLIERPRDYAVVFSFPEVVHLSPPILEVRDVDFQYKPELPWLFRGLNFGLDMNSRVCIVGPNGSGKSTILKIITGEVNPPVGEVRRNPRLRVGVYNQHFVERLPMDEDPVTYLRRLFNEETYQSVRNKLGKYGLEGHAHTIPIRDLSGGQKARVVFVELSFMAPHLLFLDEPTNNLDIESIDALCDALREYNGGVILVSHDARLIETTECQLWVVEDQGLTPWEAGFANYRQHLLTKLEEQLNAILPGAGERPK